jgi:Glycosyl transferase family 2
VTPRPAWHGDPAPAQRRALAALRASLPAGPEFTGALAARGVPRHSVSAVLPTWNRCPFSPAEHLADNPLYWAVTSMRAQAGDALAEIIVVDDGSTDHTREVVRLLAADDYPVPVRPVACHGHQGAWRARNLGAAAASSRLLYFGDDDCVFPPHTVAGAACALTVLRERDPAAAAVSTPFYYRGLGPGAVLPDPRIGTLDPGAGTFSTGFHAVPASFLDGHPPRLGEAGLLLPLPVQLIGGTALIDAGVLRAAGGFTDLSAWASGYSDHLHLSAALTDTGAHLYHCPDPRLGAAHLKFGAAGAYPLDPAELNTVIGSLGRPFGDLVAISAVPRTSTGHRLADSDFFAEQVGSFFAFFAEQVGSFFAFFALRSPSGAAAWAIRSWHEFARHGQAPTLAVAVVPGRGDRVRAWRDGLRAGAAVLLASPSPPLGRPAVGKLLREVTDACGQPEISGW